MCVSISQSVLHSNYSLHSQLIVTPSNKEVPNFQGNHLVRQRNENSIKQYTQVLGYIPILTNYSLIFVNKISLKMGVFYMIFVL